MIYLAKKSKITKRKVNFSLHPEDAIRFLYTLNYKNFTVFEYFVYGADSKEELDSVISYFTTEYLRVEPGEVFDIYHINQNVQKRERPITGGANFASLMNFKRKLEKKLGQNSVIIHPERSVFRLSINTNNIFIMMKCKYDLTIIEERFSTADGERVPISEYKDIRNFINRLFRDQRYYYRQKGRSI